MALSETLKKPVSGEELFKIRITAFWSIPSVMGRFSNQ